MCSVYERAFTSLRESQPDAKEEAVMLLEAWRATEAQAESVSADACAAAVQAVEKRMPKRIKRKVPRCCQHAVMPQEPQHLFSLGAPEIRACGVCCALLWTGTNLQGPFLHIDACPVAYGIILFI